MTSINLKTGETSSTIITNRYFLTSKKQLPVGYNINFDSVKYDIDKYKNEWKCYNTINLCVSGTDIYVYMINGDQIYSETNGVCLLTGYTILSEIEITSEVLYFFRCSLQSIVQFGLNRSVIHDDLLHFLNNNDYPDLLVEYLSHRYDRALFTKLTKTTNQISNLEALSKVITHNIDEYNAKLDFINSVIERQNLQDEDLEILLSNVKINPHPYENRINDSLVYYNLATKYKSLTDTSKITTSQSALYWSLYFQTTEVENKISESQDAFLYAVHVRASEFCRSIIASPEYAYKWALQIKKDIDYMRNIVMTNNDYFIMVLYASNIDNVEPSLDPNSLYMQYYNLIFSNDNQDNKSLYHWSQLITNNSSDVLTKFDLNANSSENQDWMLKYLEFYVNDSNRTDSNIEVLFDNITTPIAFFNWAKIVQTHIPDCKQGILNYSGSEDISYVVYYWFEYFGFDSDFVSLITNVYWKAKIEFLLGTFL